MVLTDTFPLAAQETKTDLLECTLIEEGGSRPLALYAFWINLIIHEAIVLEVASLPLFFPQGITNNFD